MIEAAGVEAGRERDVFCIPEINLGRLEEKLTALGKKARRLGTGPIGWEVVGDPVDVPHRNEITGEVEYIRRYFDVRVTGDTPVLNGWAFVATLAPLEGGVMVRTAPGLACPPEFRDGDPGRCDHCGARRRRSETFVVRHEESGAHKQVGRQCLADFLGGVSPTQAAAMLEYLAQAREACEEESFDRGGRWEERLDLAAFLATVAACIRRHGWVSRSEARDSFGEKWATADRARAAEEDRRKYGTRGAYVAARRDHRAEDWIEVEDRDRAEAEAALAWARAEVERRAAEGELPDYWHNISLIVRPEYPSVTRKTEGIAASVVAVMQREQERLRRAERQARIGAESRHVGEVGKRMQFTATLTGRRYIEGVYGTTVLHTFLTPDGCLLKWFASGGVEVGAEGEPLTFKATVKKHDEYGGVKETVLTRLS